MTFRILLVLALDDLTYDVMKLISIQREDGSKSQFLRAVPATGHFL